MVEDTMDWRHIMGLCTTAALALAVLPYDTVAQQRSPRDLLVGTWNITAQTQTRPDGSVTHPAGTNPKGVNVFTADGNFVILFMKDNLPKLAEANRAKATADEARAIVGGSIGYFGTYTFDEETKTISYVIKGTTFPNQLGVTQKRVVTLLTTDELKYTNPGAASGGRIEVSFTRAK
jgi:hypothetical protein